MPRQAALRLRLSCEKLKQIFTKDVEHSAYAKAGLDCDTLFGAVKEPGLLFRIFKSGSSIRGPKV